MEREVAEKKTARQFDSLGIRGVELPDGTTAYIPTPEGIFGSIKRVAVDSSPFFYLKYLGGRREDDFYKKLNEMSQGDYKDVKSLDVGFKAYCRIAFDRNLNARTFFQGIVRNILETAEDNSEQYLRYKKKAIANLRGRKHKEVFEDIKGIFDDFSQTR